MQNERTPTNQLNLPEEKQSLAEDFTQELDLLDGFECPIFMIDFIMPYLRDHGLQALMDHADFARSLSIELGYASQNPRPVGKKDFAQIRANHPPILSTTHQSTVSTQEFLASQMGPARQPNTTTALSSSSTSSQLESRAESPARSAFALFPRSGASVQTASTTGVPAMLSSSTNQSQALT